MRQEQGTREGAAERGAGGRTGFDPLVTIMCVALGIFTILVSRHVSLGSLGGMVALPLFVVVKGVSVWPHLLLAVALTALAIYRHRDNIRRLVAGKERRLGERESARN